MVRRLHFGGGSTSECPGESTLSLSRGPVGRKKRGSAKQQGLTRLLVCGDYPLYRAAIRTLVQTHPNLWVVAETSTSLDAVEKALEGAIDLVLLDFDLTFTSEAERQRLDRLLENIAPRPVLVLTTGLEQEACQLRGGLAGIVFKSSEPEILLDGIDRARRGEKWPDGLFIAQAFRETLARRKESGLDERRIADLTPREREIIRTVCEGLSNKQIAQRLQISEATVRHHFSSIYAKLRLTTRAELIVYAYKHHLAEFPL